MSNFYAVLKGRIPGIYTDWNECKKQTDKFPGPVFRKFSSREEAEKFLLPEKTETTPLKKKQVEIVFEDDESILYTDGAHNKVTGDEAWGSVVNKNKIDIVEDYQHLFPDMTTKIEDLPVGTRRIIVAKFTDVASQQINGAELLALVAGLRVAIFSKGIVKNIRCDSKLMTEYWSRNLKADSRAKMDPCKAKYVDELIRLRKEFEKMGGVIEKISGDDNKSDLGWHK